MRRRDWPRECEGESDNWALELENGMGNGMGNAREEEGEGEEAKTLINEAS